MTPATLTELIDAYDPALPLAEASTSPSSWYIDPRILELEERTVFARSWQLVARLDQLREPGCYVTTEVAGEPIVVVRGEDGVVRGFFNVCRHHAAAVMTEPQGCAKNLRCPYHGWTYALDGRLKGTPSFNDARNFDLARNSLVPVATASWENWVFVRLDAQGPTLEEFLGADLLAQIAPLQLSKLHWFERRHYLFDCNWKVFVDNYLDGGYHVPFLHKGLSSILAFKDYTIENFDRFCLQSSPIDGSTGEAMTASVRKGKALYYWLYPNLMLNWYEGYLDTNFVVPLGVDRMKVVFDFYFADVSEAVRERNRTSMGVSERIQDEDHAICESVQRGLSSRAYGQGRLSVRREAGENLFHKLLARDLRAAHRR